MTLQLLGGPVTLQLLCIYPGVAALLVVDEHKPPISGEFKYPIVGWGLVVIQTLSLGPVGDDSGRSCSDFPAIRSYRITGGRSPRGIFGEVGEVYPGSGSRSGSDEGPAINALEVL